MPKNNKEIKASSEEQKTDNGKIFAIFQLLNKIEISKVNISTAYWVTRNIRLALPTVKEFEKLRSDVTSDPLFKKYKEECDEATTDESKLLIKEKYKEMTDEANKELQEFMFKEVPLIKWYKITIDKIDGFDSKLIPELFDLIEE